MTRTNKFLLIAVLLLVAMVATPFVSDLAAQCPMCRMAAESNLENGGSAGKGLNAGILYMLATPYLLVAGIGYFWYRNRRKDHDEEVVEI
ncbi:MAG: hypothetical protein GYB31_07345 [Bacteroidetes bacterium]|nr:hypothetical protein [Bacteroidota bacterium]